LTVSGQLTAGGLSYPTSDGTNEQVLRTDGSGNLSFGTISGTTLNNNTNNYVMTGTGTANTLNGESGLIFDGTKLSVDAGAADAFLHLDTDSFTGTYASAINFSCNTVDATNYYQGQIGFRGENNYSGHLFFSTSNSGTTNAVTERMRIAGNNLHLNGGTDARIQLGTGGAGANQVSNNTVHIRGDGADMKFMAASGGIYQFEQNGTERMRIDNAGNVRIGSGTPVVSLDVLAGSNGGARIKQSNQITNGFVGGLEDFRRGLSFENAGSDHAFSVGYGQGGHLRISYYDAGSTYTELAEFKNSGNLNITDGDIELASGHGISFSSTGQASGMGSELLDDYEEGTWTPVTNSGSWNIGFATYTKIGNMVTCRFQVVATSTIAANDFGGLPFTAAEFSAGVCGYQNSESAITYGILVQSGASSIWNFRHGSTQKGVTNGAQIFGMFSYRT